MTEARVGRLFAASLHQAITEIIPQRVDFYEPWLGAKGWRDGSLGLAPMMAVTSFLRTEGDAYDRIVTRAGELAAEWTVASMTPFERRVSAMLPRSFRARAALRVVARVVRAVSSVSGARTTVKGQTAKLHVKDSMFCSVRERQALPLCGFYLAVALTTFRQLGVRAAGLIETCHAVGGGDCVVALDLTGLQTETATEEV